MDAQELATALLVLAMLVLVLVVCWALAPFLAAALTLRT